MLRFNRDNLKAGMWIHVRSNWWLGKGIRYALDIWEGRTCDKLGVPHAKVWGNHDGIVLSPDILQAFDAGTKRRLGVANVLPGDWAIGEALAQGSVATPMTTYEKDLTAGDKEVKVFEIMPTVSQADMDAGVIPDIAGMLRQAALNWCTDVEGHGYDYKAYIGLILKAFLGLDKDTSTKGDFWCTKGVTAAYLKAPPMYDVLQDTTPTPMHPEQVSGCIPRPKGRIRTLRDITASVMY